MKIRLLMAIGDGGYMEHLSRMLTEHYANLFEVSVCSAQDRLQELTGQRSFDVALFTPELADCAELQSIRLPLLLWDGISPAGGQAEAVQRVRMYQRVSGITSEILRLYAEVSDGRSSFDDSFAHITAVWSPAGGCGKTTAALAYAAQKVSEGRKTVYLDLEWFSSTEVYFDGQGKSISMVLEKLDGSVDLLLQSIRREDRGSGICWFCRPENYDDINILTVDDLTTLVKGCGRDADELVIDLSDACDERVRHLLEMADRVLLVVDASRACRLKWEQFRSQHNLYEKICGRLTLVANRGAKADSFEEDRTLSLPLVQSGDPVVVYKTLSDCFAGLDGETP